MGWLTAFVSDTTMALVEDGASLGSRQLDMGNSGMTDYTGENVYTKLGARPLINAQGNRTVLGGSATTPVVT